MYLSFYRLNDRALILPSMHRWRNCNRLIPGVRRRDQTSEIAGGHGWNSELYCKKSKYDVVLRLLAIKNIFEQEKLSKSILILEKHNFEDNDFRSTNERSLGALNIPL